MSSKEPYVLPEWMEPYRPLFQNTGGNTVEELMTRLNEPNLMTTNSVVCVMALSVDSQITLLHRLRAAGPLPQ